MIRIKLLANIILTNTEKQKDILEMLLVKEYYEYLYLDN